MKNKSREKFVESLEASGLTDIKVNWKEINKIAKENKMKNFVNIKINPVFTLSDKHEDILGRANKAGIKICVAGWNSNGTNDILFVDNNHTILGGLNEALFGFRISSCKAGTYQFSLYGESMIGMSAVEALDEALDNAVTSKEAERIKALDSSDALQEFSESIDSPFYHWESIDIEDALEKIAINPMLSLDAALGRFFDALRAVV